MPRSYRGHSSAKFSKVLKDRGYPSFPLRLFIAEEPCDRLKVCLIRVNNTANVKFTKARNYVKSFFFCNEMNRSESLIEEYIQ